MAISPWLATWTADESLPNEPELPSLSEPVSSGQFVSTGHAAPFAQESLSTALAQIIAKTKGVDPTDDGFQLFDHLDPEALDSMYNHARRTESASWQLEFTVGDETVHVTSDGSFEIIPSY